MRATPLERAAAKINFLSPLRRTPSGAEGGCWLWTASLTHNGYGKFWVDGAVVRAHRWIYEQLVGPIPDGLHLDHVHERGCRSRRCVNPAHLEPVTNEENQRRKQPSL